MSKLGIGDLKMGTSCDPEVYYTTVSPDIQAAQAAVVEKVRAWVHEVAESVGRLSKAEVNLLTALSSLDALQPKGLRPEEVKPGTRFRWAEGCGRDHDNGTYELMEMWEAGAYRSCFVEAAKGRVYRFDPADRIIPEPQE